MASEYEMEEALRRSLAAAKAPNFAKIAVQHGVSTNVVRRVAITMGLPRPRAKVDAELEKRIEDLLRNGVPATRAAKQLGVSEYRALDVQRRLFPGRYIERLRKRQKALELVVHQGMSARAACRQLGIEKSQEWVSRNAKLARLQQDRADENAKTDIKNR